MKGFLLGLLDAIQVMFVALGVSYLVIQFLLEITQ